MDKDYVITHSVLLEDDMDPDQDSRITLGFFSPVSGSRSLVRVMSYKALLVFFPWFPALLINHQLTSNGKLNYE